LETSFSYLKLRKTVNGRCIPPPPKKINTRNKKEKIKEKIKEK